MRERRVTGAAVQRIAASLGDRDWAILRDVARVRVLASKQVERLHFAELTGVHRDRTRRRVLERLTNLQLLTPLERRIGGVRAGSAGLLFALGPAGQRLVAVEATGRVRQPGTPTERFLAHNLAVAELYVGLVEAARESELTLGSFDAEPDCWWRDQEGEWVKPDACAVVSRGDIEDTWAIEVDMATESVPTLRRKLNAYENLVVQGDRGPGGGPLPRVLIVVPDERRLAAVHALLRTLRPPADELFALTTVNSAVAYIQEVLRE
jgi:hypothetical protein